ARGRGLLRAERTRRDDARRHALRRRAGRGDPHAHRQLAWSRAGRRRRPGGRHHLRDQVIAVGAERRPEDLLRNIAALFELSARKIIAIERSWSPADGGAPAFTVEGRYRARGWTEWTEGFQYGSALLQFDATGEREFFELGRTRTVERM